MITGIVKTQWYSQWIKQKALQASTNKQPRELDQIHEFLKTVRVNYICTDYITTISYFQFESPLWAGHLPVQVGEPAGGSLTADEYKFATTGPWAIIVSCYILHLTL